VEFSHALGRQSALRGEEKKALIAKLSQLLGDYLKNIEDDQMRAMKLEDADEGNIGGYLKNLKRTQVSDVIGLCQTVAFAHRTRRENQS
ncbi:MAG: hypothetical protein WCK17_04990, partial [Verrucomicrobiota bacterium]